MLNIKVFDELGNPHYLDLYETEPIKLNFSIEDIRSTVAKGIFSRVFRVPSTTRNNQFLKMAFLIDGIDFDVTRKVPADIEVGGALFRSGQIRLQNIFRNEAENRIDYELLYLGETRDLSSVLGERTLCQLDGSSLAHTLNYTNITTSWNAFPQGTSGIGGLLGGDVLYPLVDHGNTYSGTTPQEPEIRTTGTVPFTNVLNPLTVERFKPVIRTKKIIDLIFEQAGFTYSSTFLNSLFFRKLYVSAWGNEPTPLTDTTQTQNLFQAQAPGFIRWNGLQTQLIHLSQINYDPGGNYNNQPAPPPPFAYTVPITGNYTFEATGSIQTTPLPNTGVSFARVEIWVNGVFAAAGNITSLGISSVQYTAALTAGDYVQLYVRWSTNILSGFIEDATLTCTRAVGDIVPTFLLDCEYKQVDFLRDILTLFRCVLAPDISNPNNFIIEPWDDYVAKGNILDWTRKVDRNKDFSIEPLFFDQTDEIMFKFTPDEDWLNQNNQDVFKQVYGELRFDSGNELLKGTRDITVGFAPTPTIQVEGEPASSDWIIPQPHLHDSEGGVTLHEPIKPITRILFYNGLVPTPLTWYVDDGVATNALDDYPQVSYQEGAPPGINGLNLNWDRWFPYWGTQVPGYNGLVGQSLYERYWGSYINTLYNKFARRVTCYVVLNAVDLQDFSFDDVIFIDGVYYIPEKIVDAPIGEKASVQVQLIKLLNFSPPRPGPAPPQFFYYIIQETDCEGVFGPQLVMQSAAPIDLGDFVQTQGDPACYQVIAPSSSLVWDKIFQTLIGDCETCIDPPPPSYVYYVEQYTSECPNTFSPGLTVSTNAPLSVGDTVILNLNPGCWRIIGPSFLVPVDTIFQVSIDCESCLEQEFFAKYLVENCLDPTETLVVDSSISVPLGAAVTLASTPGCWTVVAYSSSTATDTITTAYTDCETCIAENPEPLVFELENCLTSSPLIATYLTPLTPGQAVRVDTSDGCWEVVGPSVSTPTANIITTYPDCETCGTLPEPPGPGE